MSAARSFGIVLLMSLNLAGCSNPPAPVAAQPDPRPEVYEPVYRVATELRSAQEVGTNRQRFGELLSKFATEVTMAKDRARSAKEQLVVGGYEEVLQTYKDAAKIWDVKISIPEIGQIADQQAKTSLVTGSNDGILRNFTFQTAISKGIPLNLFEPGSTGIDGLVTKYQLPVKDTEGWKTIPTDSVEQVWSRARAKTEDVVKLQKG